MRWIFAIALLSGCGGPQQTCTTVYSPAVPVYAQTCPFNQVMVGVSTGNSNTIQCSTLTVSCPIPGK